MQNTGQAPQPITVPQQPVGYAVSQHPGDIPLHAIPQSVGYREVLGAELRCVMV